jgi:hypothetical protein
MKKEKSTTSDTLGSPLGQLGKWLSREMDNLVEDSRLKQSRDPNRYPEGSEYLDDSEYQDESRFRQYGKYSDVYYHDLMLHPSIPAVILEIAARDRCKYVRRAVMENPNATPDILADGARDENWLVRRAALKNPNNSFEWVLEEASFFDDWSCRVTVMTNPNTPIRILKRGLKDENRYVREVAEKELAEREKLTNLTLARKERSNNGNDDYKN